VGELRERFGSARRPDRPIEHPKPAGSDDATVAAVGRLSAAFEVVENARGLLYAFHRMTGEADQELQEVVRMLRAAGHTELADEIDDVLVGRDVVKDMWTFQIVEAYDEQYYRVFREVDRFVRARLSGEQPHVYEAEMKHREQIEGSGG
jgi:hypothetical protein